VSLFHTVDNKMVWRLSVLLILGGCGRYGFDQRPIDGAGDAPGIDAVMACATGYTQLIVDEAHLYRRSPAMTWAQQRLACESDGGYLAIPDTQRELEGLVVPGANAWVGISDSAVEGAFVTVTGVPATFLPWAPTQPDNFNQNEDCVLVLSAAMQLNDEPCQVPRPGVCECDPGV
jgi:hypothetical protein